MVLRRGTDSSGNRVFFVSAWVMNSALTIILAWVTSITYISWQNSMELGLGPRFTQADGNELRTEIVHLSNDLRDVILLYEACDAKIDFDRERRAEIFAEFQLLRRGLVDHAREDDRRFGLWIRDGNGETNAADFFSPAKDSIVPH